MSNMCRTSSSWKSRVVLQLKPGACLLEQGNRNDFLRDASSGPTRRQARDERDRCREEVEREAFVDSRNEGGRDDLRRVFDASNGQ
jgi:hypothetical protein